MLTLQLLQRKSSGIKLAAIVAKDLVSTFIATPFLFLGQDPGAEDPAAGIPRLPVKSVQDLLPGAFQRPLRMLPEFSLKA